MEDQLQRLIKAVTDSFEAMMQAIRESNHEEFVAVRDRLNSIFDVVSRKTPWRHVMQEVSSISFEPQARNVQVPSTTIDAGSEEVNLLLQPFQRISLDLNKLPAQALVELQHVANQELVDRKKELSDGYVQSQSIVEKLQKEAEELH